MNNQKCLSDRIEDIQKQNVILLAENKELKQNLLDAEQRITTQEDSLKVAEEKMSVQEQLISDADLQSAEYFIDLDIRLLQLEWGLV